MKRFIVPESVEETTFVSHTPYPSRDRYRFETRHAIGRVKY